MDWVTHQMNAKVLRDFSSKYVKGRPAKDRGQDPLPRNKFNSQQEKSAIVNSAVDEILLHENKKVSAAKKAPEHIECDFDEN